VEKKIRETADSIWRRIRGAGYAPRPGTTRERLRDEAKGRGTTLEEELQKAWKQKWSRSATRRQRRPPAVWTTPWEQDSRKLYADLSKAQATALFLMRTEVIGLKAWLASIGVPEVNPLCECGQAM
jgi:hypothetical protein